MMNEIYPNHRYGDAQYSPEKRECDSEERVFLLALPEIVVSNTTNTKFYQRLKNDIPFWESTLSYLDAG
jgi:hypothetical protein